MMSPDASEFLGTVREWLRLYSDVSSSASFVNEAVIYIQNLSETEAIVFLRRLEAVDDNILPSLTLSKACWKTDALLACSDVLACRDNVSEMVFLQCLDRILKTHRSLMREDLCEKTLLLIKRAVYPWSWIAAEKLYPCGAACQWLKNNPLPHISFDHPIAQTHESQAFFHDPENVHRTGLVAQVREHLRALRNEYYSCLGGSIHHEAMSLESRIEDEDMLRCVYTDMTIFYLDPVQEVFPLRLCDAWRYVLVAVRSASIAPSHFIERHHEECHDFVEVCFMGRLSRMINILSGIHPSIQLRIDMQDAMRYRWRQFVQDYIARLPREACEKILIGMISSYPRSKERKAWIDALRYLIPEFLWIVRSEFRNTDEMFWHVLQQEDSTLDRSDFDLR